MADRADGFAFVFRTVRLGAVFDNPQVMFFGQSHDVVHFGRHTGKVNHDDGFGVWRQSGFDGFGADVLAVQIDIGENGFAPAVTMQDAEAKKVREVTITSSPWPMPIALSATSKANVPLERATAYCVPTKSSKFFFQIRDIPVPVQ